MRTGPRWLPFGNRSTLACLPATWWIMPPIRSPASNGCAKMHWPASAEITTMPSPSAVPVHGSSGLKLLTATTREFHWKVLGTSHLRFLAKLPVTKYLTLDGKRFLLIHGTPRDPLDEYLTADAEAWSSRLAAVDVDFVCVGHTHIPFHLQLERLQVVNPGSVGQPRDGDPRCSYAVIDNGVVEIRRVEYDIDATLRQMQDSGLDPAAVQVAEQMLRTGGILMENPREDAE